MFGTMILTGAMAFLGAHQSVAMLALFVVGVASFFSATPEGRLLVSMGVFDSGGGLLSGPYVPKTADYTIVTGTDPSGTVFTNRGATGTVIFTLPAPSQGIAGTVYHFLGIADYTVTVKTATADTLITKNDLTADSLSFQTAGELIGARMSAVCDGTSWIANGTAVGFTYTVAT